MAEFDVNLFASVYGPKLDEANLTDVHLLHAEIKAQLSEAGYTWERILRLAIGDDECEERSDGRIPPLVRGTIHIFFERSQRTSGKPIGFLALKSIGHSRRVFWGLIAIFDEQDLQTLRSGTTDILTVAVVQAQSPAHRPHGRIILREPTPESGRPGASIEPPA